MSKNANESRRKFVVKPRDTTNIREGKHTETGNSNPQQPSWRPNYIMRKPTYSEVVSTSHERRNEPPDNKELTRNTCT